MSAGGDEPAPKSKVGAQYLALQALSELSRDVLEIVAEQESGQDNLDSVSAYQRALVKRGYTARELLEIQIISANHLAAIAELIQKQLHHSQKGS